MNVIVQVRVGKYNMLSTEEQERGGLWVDNEGVSYLWDEGECPFREDDPPSEVIPFLREKMAKLWINTGREKDTERLDKWEANIAAIDDAWAKKMLEQVNMQMERLELRKKGLSLYLISED